MVWKKVLAVGDWTRHTGRLGPSDGQNNMQRRRESSPLAAGRRTEGAAKRRVLDVSQREVQQRLQRRPGIEILARKKDDPRRTLARGAAGGKIKTSADSRRGRGGQTPQ
jgi:hypothetical protein